MPRLLWLCKLCKLCMLCCCCKLSSEAGAGAQARALRCLGSLRDAPKVPTGVRGGLLGSWPSSPQLWAAL